MERRDLLASKTNAAEGGEKIVVKMKVFAKASRLRVLGHELCF